MKKIPIGIENFKEIIDNDYYYIDKSMFIKDVLDEKFVLYTRPRRFGKTLNMSMLYYFLSNKEKDNAYLFDNLEISNYPEIMKHQNQYPVIFITLKDMIEDTFENQIEKYTSLIADVIKKNNELLKSEFVDEADRNVLKNLKNRTGSLVDLKESLYRISQCMEQHYHQNVIILIDEYDVPLQNAYLNGYYNEMVNLLRGVFSKALKTNDALEKGILTGCLRISKESIFTGLNNFNVYSVMDYRSSQYYGFKQDEVNQLLKDYQLEKYLDEVKYWYDGYLFGDTEIYNPWSTLKYVDRKLQNENLNAVSFWANTSGNSIVVDYIENADNQLHEEFEQLMQGKAITKRIKQELTYKEMDNQDNIYSFLLLTGYLKAVKEVDYQTYELVIPNKEVYEIYHQSFMEYFNSFSKQKKNEFVEALKAEDVAQASKALITVMKKSLSFYDNYESFYHGFLLGMINGYEIESNREAGDGRLDIVIYPEIFQDKAIIIECKHSSNKNDLMKDSREAVKQIKDKHYLEGTLAKGYDEAVGYGISFYKKQCYITKA